MQEETNTVRALTAEIDSAFTPGGAAEIGMLTLKSANQTIEDASKRPDPEQLYLELWYEGEVCCLFADSNLGKSIFAVQMGLSKSMVNNIINKHKDDEQPLSTVQETPTENGQLDIFDPTQL